MAIAPHRRMPLLAVPAIVLAAGVFGWCSFPACANPMHSDGLALVRQLGHPDYALREAAAAQLTRLGLKMHDVLVAGLRDADPEVRRRCRMILSRVLEADYEQRIAALLADTAGGEHDLPGWAWYRKAVGSDPHARVMFATVLRAEPGLLASAERGPAEAEAAFQHRFAQLYREMHFPDHRFRRQPSVESVSALLMVAVNPQWRLPGQLVDSNHLLNFLRSGPFARVLSEVESTHVARRLVGRWILVQGVPSMAHQKLRLAMQFDIPEGLFLALDLLDRPGVHAPNMAASAAEAVARLGGARWAERLLPLLDDERPCARAGRRAVQVRDVALAWLVHLTRQDLAPYGLAGAESWFQNVARNRSVMFRFTDFGHDDPAEREAALTKWVEWLAANPLPSPPATGGHILAERPVDPNPLRPPTPLSTHAAPPAAAGLDMADRALVRSLQRAKRLAELGEYTAAVQILGLLLAAENDFVFQPDRNVSLYRNLKPAAEQVLGQLPEAGRAAYAMLFDAEARYRLDEALAGDRRDVARVAQDYFYTEAGAEAAYLLGASHWQAGRFFSAAAYWQRLADSGRRARRFEPALSLQLASCWTALGKSDRIPHRLEPLRSRYAGAPIEIAGRSASWFDDDAAGWLVRSLGHLPAGDEGQWSLFRGRPSRNPVGAGGSPYLVARPLDEPARNGLLRRAIDRVRNDYFGPRRAGLPTLNPLVVGEAIVARTATRIRAVDGATGTLLWEALPNEPLRDVLATAAFQRDDLAEELLTADLLRRMWQELVYGTLSSDGRFVFAVEGLPMHGLSGAQRVVVADDGTRQLAPGAHQADNLLAAYDVATGKLQWELGGPMDGDGRRLAGAYFLGPPLPLGASLYCLAEIESHTVLLVLDAATGHLQWQRTLAVGEPPSSQAAVRLPGFAIPQIQHPAVRGSGSGALSYADGMLVCPLGNQRVAGVDLTNRNVVWLYEGQGALFEEPIANRRVREARAQLQHTPPNDRWVDSCMTVAEGHVLLTFPESDRLICLRLNDGTKQWTAPRADGLYVGAVHNGIAMVVGRGHIRGLRMADGEAAWDNDFPLPPGAVPSGRGFLSGEKLYVPLSTAEVIGVDAASGRMVSRARSPAGIVPGNLVGLRDAVISQTADGLWRFDLTRDHERLAARRTAEDPDDAVAWTERGELLLSEGRIGEAIRCLTHARQLAPTEQARLRVARAVTDGLWADYQRFRPLAESLELDAMEEGNRASVIRSMAWSAQRAGDRAVALDLFLQLAGFDPAADVLEPVSAAVRVRRDRWLAARLDELLHEACPEERASVQPRLAALSAETRTRYRPLQPATSDASILAAAAREGAPAHADRAGLTPWPRGELEAVATSHRRQSIVDHLPVRIRPVDPQSDRTAHVRVDTAGRTLFGYDGLGRQTWELPLKPRTPPIALRARGHHYPAEGLQMGQVLVAWLATRVCAIDLSGAAPRLLWDYETIDLDDRDPRLRHRIQVINRQMFPARAGGQPGGSFSPLLVTRDYACFARQDELVAVDSESGKFLWTRDDLPDNIGLFGDARYVFAVSDEEGGDARVFSALDGRELGRRALPPRAGRLVASGRRLLTWDDHTENPRLYLFDPWNGETVWQEEMAAGTQVALIRHGRVAALSPEGRFHVFRADSGELFTSAELDVGPKLDHLHVATYGETFLVFANRAPEATAPRIVAHQPSRAVSVHGSLHGVSPEGTVLWNVEIANQQLDPDLAPDLPVLLFSTLRRHQTPRPDGRMSTKVQHSVLCIDKRSGRTLLDETFDASHGAEMLIQGVDPKAGVIEIQTRHTSIRIAGTN